MPYCRNWKRQETPGTQEEMTHMVAVHEGAGPILKSSRPASGILMCCRKRNGSWKLRMKYGGTRPYEEPVYQLGGKSEMGLVCISGSVISGVPFLSGIVKAVKNLYLQRRPAAGKSRGGKGRERPAALRLPKFIPTAVFDTWAGLIGFALLLINARYKEEADDRSGKSAFLWACGIRRTKSAPPGLFIP